MSITQEEAGRDFQSIYQESKKKFEKYDFTILSIEGFFAIYSSVVMAVYLYIRNFPDKEDMPFWKNYVSNAQNILQEKWITEKKDLTDGILLNILGSIERIWMPIESNCLDIDFVNEEFIRECFFYIREHFALKGQLVTSYKDGTPSEEVLDAYRKRLKIFSDEDMLYQLKNVSKVVYKSDSYTATEMFAEIKYRLSKKSLEWLNNYLNELLDDVEKYDVSISVVRDVILNKKHPS